MSCNIHFQPDFMAIRVNNGGLNITPLTWTNILATDSDLQVLVKTTLKTNFIATTSSTATEWTDYFRVGQVQSDSTFLTAIGDVIEDASGLRPANNFDMSAELNIYAPPDMLYNETSAVATYTTMPTYMTEVATMVTKCNTLDLLAIDSNNLVAMFMGQLSGHFELPQLMGQWVGKITLTRKNATGMQNLNLIKLTSLT